MVDNTTDIGGNADRIVFAIDGQPIKNYAKYTFKRGILNQPSSFSVTLGSGDTARSLLRQLKPGMECTLRIGTTKVFSGLLEDPTAGGSEATEVTIEGRDWLAPLTKNDIMFDRAFGSPTYYDLTKEVMKIVGYDEDIKLIGGNDSNRKSVSRVRATAAAAKQLVESIETGAVGNQGAKLQYNKIKAEIGGSWFDFLVSQNKKVGLYLWCSGEGDLILAKPTAFMGPIYAIKRYRGIPRTYGSVLSGALANRTSARHAWCRCYGKGAPDKNGRRPVFGDWHDHEMYALGYRDQRVVHDSECTTWVEAQYVAKRHLAEERRQARTIIYTVSGHTVPSLTEPGVMAIWTPDTVVRVDDDELCFPGEESQGIHEELYVESVTMSRSPATTTQLSLMRKTDLLYLGEDTDNEGAQPPAQMAPRIKRKRLG